MENCVIKFLRKVRQYEVSNRLPTKGLGYDRSIPNVFLLSNTHSGYTERHKISIITYLETQCQDLPPLLWESIDRTCLGIISLTSLALSDSLYALQH